VTRAARPGGSSPGNGKAAVRRIDKSSSRSERTDRGAAPIGALRGWLKPHDWPDDQAAWSWPCTCAAQQHAAYDRALRGTCPLTLGLRVDSYGRVVAAPADAGQEAPLAAADDMATMRTLADILADPSVLEPPSVVVPRLAWRGRVTLLAAREKGGKSTLATAAAAAVSRGDRWLGDPTERGSVLWVGLEEHVGDLASRMIEWRAAPERIYVMQSLATVNDPIAEVRAKATQVRPAMLVVDTLSAMVEATGARPDPGSSTAWTPIMTGLARIARETDAALLLLHHARRSDGSYRDSSAIGAGVDVIIEASEGPDADVRTLKSKGRWRVGDYTVRLVSGEPTQPARYDLGSGEVSVDARVLCHVEAHPGCSMRDVRNAITGRGKEVGAAVHRLIGCSAIVDRGGRDRMSLHPARAAGQLADDEEAPDPKGNHAGSGEGPQGIKAEPPSGTTVVPAPKPRVSASGTTPDAADAEVVP